MKILAFNEKYFLFLNAIRNNIHNLPSYKLGKHILGEQSIGRYLKDMKVNSLIEINKKGRTYILTMTNKGNKLLDFYNTFISTRKEVN